LDPGEDCAEEEEDGASEEEYAAVEGREWVREECVFWSGTNLHYSW
jgi:hypothetical protein